jgi:hypothetical protein
MELINVFTLLAAGMVAYTPQPQSYGSLKEQSKRINRLASPDAITSELASREYVDALASHWGLVDPSFDELKIELARLEFASLQNSRATISEENVARSFNLLMTELRAPERMRLTRMQVHTFRRNLLLINEGTFVYPNMFARRGDGTIDDNCRPVEALFLIFLLQYGPNFEASQSLTASRPGKEAASLSRGTLVGSRPRESRYASATDYYSQRHKVSEFAELLDRTLKEVLSGDRTC